MCIYNCNYSSGRKVFKMQNRIIREDLANIANENLNWDKLEGKTILISGAAGFIPSYIVETIMFLNETKFNKKAKIIGLVRNLEKAQIKFLHHKDREDLILVKQDISRPFDLGYKIDYIIHAASQASPKYYGIDPVGTLNANVLGTSYLLELAKKNKVEKFLFFSSGEVYGAIGKDIDNIKETYTGNVDITNVRSCYAESKRMGENMCVCYSHQFGFDVSMIRLSHTYGPGVSFDDGRVFGDFVRDVVNNKNITLNSDGSAQRCFCYISDMIVACFMVLFNGENAQAYNISSPVETSILELAQMLVNLYPEKGLKVAFSQNVFSDGYIKSPSSRLKFDTEKIRALGWEPKIDIMTGFDRMIRSYEEAECIAI